jgi:hexosaminidase
VVAYAQARHITVVPEIEMPGHCRAALAAYPELACSGNHFEVARSWGVFEDVMCPTPFTIAFVQNVLSEVMDLFPSRYIHVGGDECPKTRWKQSAYCQNLMKELDLNNETQLQSWFVSKMDSFIRSNNRRLIGWDEILDGDLSPETAVMNWQGIERGISAAKKRHEVVMSPTSHMYFDYYQALGAQEPLAIGGYLPIDTVYAFEPVPAALAPEEQKYILGVQANLWTEYVADFRQAEYMTFPRLCALAEVAWTPKENRNFHDFSMRLTRHLFPMLDRLGVNYSKAIYQLNMEVASAAAGIHVALASRDSSLHIRYRYIPADQHNDSSDPFQEYEAPIHITSSGILHVESSGSHSSAFSFSQAFEINKATGKNISLDEPPDAKYSTGGAFTLVNGIEARLPWHGSEWLGFWGRDLMATIDLGQRQHISSVGVGVLEENGSWIYLPSRVDVSVSDDGKQFLTVGELSGREIKLQGGRRALFSFPEVSARYVKVTAINHGLIAGGNPGAGFRAWLFVDEIAVR